jgi:hypothetical protein
MLGRQLQITSFGIERPRRRTVGHLLYTASFPETYAVWAWSDRQLMAQTADFF